MDTARELTLFLRRELACERILARPDSGSDRWCVYEIQRRCGLGWDVPFKIEEDGTVVRRAPATVRLVHDQPLLIYVHEKGGQYAEADRYAILAALRKQDRWASGHEHLERDLIQEVADRKAKKLKESSDAFAALAGETRGLFVKAADEMGL